jgi:predicted DsbA family dithiol-disulfide isomerase
MVCCPEFGYLNSFDIHMNKPLTVDYYSDILCVWAWIAQRRIDELNEKLQNKIVIQHHYVDVFGDLASKIDNQWKDKGGYLGFAEHVKKSAASFETPPVNEKVWTEVRPATSANAHLMLKAIQLVHGSEISIKAALLFRQAFFIEALDISNMNTLFELVKEQKLDVQALTNHINDGSAIATLMKDYQMSKLQSIKGSPSFILDEGRQTLYGNVGYRVLLSNIEELQKKPLNEASWC